MCDCVWAHHREAQEKLARDSRIERTIDKDMDGVRKRAATMRAAADGPRPPLRTRTQRNVGRTGQIVIAEAARMYNNCGRTIHSAKHIGIECLWRSMEWQHKQCVQRSHATVRLVHVWAGLSAEIQPPHAQRSSLPLYCAHIIQGDSVAGDRFFVFVSTLITMRYISFGIVTWLCSQISESMIFCKNCWHR